MLTVSQTWGAGGNILFAFFARVISPSKMKLYIIIIASKNDAQHQETAGLVSIVKLFLIFQI